MRKLEIRREFEAGSVRLRLLGDVDGRTARLLRAEIELLPRSLAVIVDFTGVVPFSDLAIAVLSHELRATRRSLSLVGLNRHQERLFRYFGVPLHAPEPVGDEALS